MASGALADEPRSTRLVWLVLLLGMAVLLTFIDRGAMGVSAPLMKQELKLSATSFGMAVSAFFWVYAPMCLVVGWLCDRFCVYRLFALGVGVWALSTLLTGWVGGVASLVVLRLFLGLGECIAFPGSSKIFAAEVPAAHRGIANAVVGAAIAFGPAVGTLAGGAILASAGWRAVFWTFGAITLLWLVPWLIVSGSFRAKALAAPAAEPIRLGPLLRIPALWKMGIAHFTSNFGFYVLLTWLPLYLVQQRGYSLSEMAVIASAGFVAQGIVSLISGKWSDWLVARGADEDRVRRRILAVSQLFVAFSIGCIIFTTSRDALLLCLILGGIGMGGVGVNIFAVGQIFAGPRAAGTWIGVQNTVANLAGVVAPVLTGLIIDQWGYDWAFAAATLVAGLGALWWWLVIPPIRQLVH